MNTDLLAFLNFPALIIDESGKVISRSKFIKRNYPIYEGDNFFSLSESQSSLAEFVRNLSNMPLGSNDKCLSHLNFSKKNIEIYISIISKKPALFLIEFGAESPQKNTNKDLADHSDNLLSLVDQNYQYLSVNEQYSHKWGIEQDKIVNSHVATVLGEEAFHKIVKKELDLCFAGEVRKYSDWFYSENRKQMVFMKVSYQPVFDRDSGKVKSVAVTATDITDIQVQNEALTEHAFHDVLTALDNRRSLFNYFDKLIANLKRNESYTLAILDLNNFKTINDKHGHNVGDALLKEFSRNLANTLRADDFCCRWGGDEFVCILPLVKLSQDFETTRKFIIERFEPLQEKTYQIDELTTKLNFSLGFAVFPEQSNDLIQLIAIADRQMYDAKNAVKQI